MRKHSILESLHTTNIKLHMKGDQASICNLQTRVTIFSGLYLILCFALCRYIVAWYVWYVLCINEYIFLWYVKHQIWSYQLRVWTISVLIKLFVWYLISLGLTPAHDKTLWLHNDLNLPFLFIFYFHKMAPMTPSFSTYGHPMHIKGVFNGCDTLFSVFYDQIAVEESAEFSTFLQVPNLCRRIYSYSLTSLCWRKEVIWFEACRQCLKEKFNVKIYDFYPTFEND